MGQYNLNRIFKPRKIAVVGASRKTGTIGNALMTNLIDGEFEGDLLPVNPKYDGLHGLTCFASVDALPGDVDLAVIATPIQTVPDIVASCVKQKMAGAVVISAGGKEVGEAGKKIESKIRKIAYDGGLRIVGPNCLGIMCPGAALNASFASEMPGKGNLAFVSQSGAICTSVLDLAFKEHFGFSHFISIGSMLDVDFGDLIDYLGNDPSTKGILLYIENLTNIRKFMSAARAVSRIKPIIVLKAGRSDAGAKAAASHTGALAGEDGVYDAAFKRAGIVRVNTIEELFDCAELVAKQPRSLGPGLAIITNGGGPGVMATDCLAEYGHAPAPLPPEATEALDAVLPGFWSRANPIDILGDADPERFRNVINICFKTSGIHGVLLILAPQALSDPMAIADVLVTLLKDHKFPVVTCWMGGRRIQGAMDLLNRAGIATYETPERAVKAFLYLRTYAENLVSLTEVPPKLANRIEINRDKAEDLINQAPSGNFMSDTDCKALLASYGLPVLPAVMAVDEDDAVQKAGQMGYPLAMKLFSPDISHKTEAGGVCLDLRSETEVRSAFKKIKASAAAYQSKAQVAGVLLQPFMAAADYEILLGAKQDPNFGPVLLFGAGGIFTEVLRDRALGLPPFNRLLAKRLMESTNVYTILKGFRNRPPADMEQLQEMIIRLSQLLMDFPQICELDMNPVLIKDGKAHVVDARLKVEDKGVLSPRHLVISPYPAELERNATLKGGFPVFIRPVRPEDAPMFKEFFTVLSPTSIYYRFFTPLREIKPAMLARFTQIDYDREIALIALQEANGSERMVGVARIIGDADAKKGEFAVLVGDPWHGKGIGGTLLQNCLDIARERRFEHITGFVLPENKNMVVLGKKLGFSVARNPDAGEVELTMRF